MKSGVEQDCIPCSDCLCDRINSLFALLVAMIHWLYAVYFSEKCNPKSVLMAQWKSFISALYKSCSLKFVDLCLKEWWALVDYETNLSDYICLDMKFCIKSAETSIVDIDKYRYKCLCCKCKNWGNQPSLYFEIVPRPPKSCPAVKWDEFRVLKTFMWVSPFFFYRIESETINSPSSFSVISPGLSNWEVKNLVELKIINSISILSRFIVVLSLILRRRTWKNHFLACIPLKTKLQGWVSRYFLTLPTSSFSIDKSVSSSGKLNFIYLRKYYESVRAKLFFTRWKDEALFMKVT